MDKPLVSIVINNYNYGRFLPEAIDSALGQTYSNTQVIVVDDGSTDNSREIIASYGGRIVPVFKENGGQASAFNAGFAASQGESVCFLDSDDVFFPDKTAEVAAAFERYPEVGWCFHPLRTVDENGNPLIEVGPEAAPRLCDFRLNIERGKLDFYAPATSGLCFRSSLLRSILPMPEATTVSLSDNYLKWVAFVLSKGVLLGKVLALHRIHGDNWYAFRDDKQRLRARILVLTAYWMRAKLPSSTRFTNKLLAAGISSYQQAGGVEAEQARIVEDYLSSISVWERAGISLRAVYYRLRDAYRRLRS